MFAALNAFQTAGGAIVGSQAAFTTAGTFSWTAPAGVTSVCVVCIGGGGSGATGQTSSKTNGGDAGGVGRREPAQADGELHAAERRAAGSAIQEW